MLQGLTPVILLDGVWANDEGTATVERDEVLVNVKEDVNETVISDEEEVVGEVDGVTISVLL